MSRVIELLCSRRVPHVAVLALMSFGFAGCSGDMSTRLSQDPFSNPFASQPEATASVSTPAVERRELPQYSRPQSLPPIAAPQSYPAPGAGVSGGGRGLASYAPPAQPQLEATGSVTAPRSVAATGGTTIIVGTSDTLEILARRYNVSPAAILQANGYKGPRALSPGQQLIIPHPTVAVAAPALAAPASKVVVAAAAPTVHVVNRGDTLLSIARRNHVPLSQLAKANGLEPTAKLKIGDKLTVPGVKTAATPATGGAADQPPANALTPPSTKLAGTPGNQPQSAHLAQTAPKLEEVPAETPVKAADATGALPTFRWPVRGKVITSYGAKTNGKANDGINLAVPEGTPVKAAEDGVVAYSGNELKGYGNLVLIRHSNGYVTAYAHASELMVKRGETIKRGQVIAKSGQSGEVGSPQLHFEIRKGSAPVDPLQFLNGA
ncbi:MAG TPA: LysM peptidoglycan-binding domain-containing M23 family metallopeptidase [Bradyrhizobium sp.]|nr:LysM peptidoglycan-binding domain-containing M23 family metallopeptidase [Bradyrhizobium sp.]